LGVLGLLEVFLVGVEIDVQDGGLRLVLILPRRHGRKIGTRLEERSQRIDHEEDDEDVVEIESSLTHLLPLLRIAPISPEGVAAL
jgi:hypothetical protein